MLDFSHLMSSFSSLLGRDWEKLENQFEREPGLWGFLKP